MRVYVSACVCLITSGPSNLFWGLLEFKRNSGKVIRLTPLFLERRCNYKVLFEPPSSARTFALDRVLQINQEYINDSTFPFNLLYKDTLKQTQLFLNTMQFTIGDSYKFQLDLKKPNCHEYMKVREKMRYICISNII